MTTIGIEDPVTTRLIDYLAVNGRALVKEARSASVLFRTRPITMPLHTVRESAAEVQSSLEALVRTIERLCSAHAFDRFLLLFRKMPHEMGLALLRTPSSSEREALSLFSAIYFEAVLFGTNCILAHCGRNTTFISNNARYRFTPTTAELHDAARVFLLSVIHRHALFYMNSIMRQELVEAVSLDVLLDVYNRRLRERWRPKPTATSSEVLVLPGSVHLLSPSERERRLTDRTGSERLLGMRNQLPVPCDAEVEFRRYEYLDTDDFSTFAGIPFTTFRKVWIGLNRLLTSTFPLLWSEKHVRGIDPEMLSARLEQADDYCETGIGGAPAEQIWSACHELLARYDSPAECPTREDCRKVVEFLTFRKLVDDIRFTEQPFVFYPVTEGLVYWDYLRHGGLLRCLARNLTRDPRAVATREKKGDALEAAVLSKVSAIAGVCGARKWIYREGGKHVWDVDVGFVYRNVLFLIDAKNEQKSIRYYFDPVEVSGKITAREDFLQKLDDRLGQHADRVHAHWSDCGPLDGAICVVCTEEAEFIASAHPGFWLETLEVPRTCMLAELTACLHREGFVDRVRQNPAFFPFPP